VKEETVSTAADFVIGSLCAWRGANLTNGAKTLVDVEELLQLRIDALIAKAAQAHTSIYIEATRSGVFPEMTVKGNPELVMWPYEDDRIFKSALVLMEKAIEGAMLDGTLQSATASPLLSIVVGSLCAWREDRGGGCNGMQAVLNVLVNRAAAHKTSIYKEAVRPMQFSAMTAPHDPELTLWPAATDDNFDDAQQLTEKAAAGTLEDLTGGAVSYYAKSMKTAPYWAATMTPTAEIGGQLYFRLGPPEKHAA
jgi:hypothetical protein